MGVVARWACRIYRHLAFDVETTESRIETCWDVVKGVSGSGTLLVTLTWMVQVEQLIVESENLVLYKTNLPVS